MDPATIAAIGSLAGLLKDGGPWVVIAILVLVVVRLDGKLEKEREGRRDDAKGAGDAYADLLERCIGVLERAAGTMAAVSAALDSRTGVFERVSGLVEEVKALIREVQQDADTADERLRERVAENTKRLESILSRLDDIGRGLRP